MQKEFDEAESEIKKQELEKWKKEKIKDWKGPR